MNPIARQALAKAFGRPLPAQHKPAPTAKPPAPAATPAPVPASNNVAKPETPYSHLLFLEGRKAGTDIVLSMSALAASQGGKQQLIEKLAGAMVGRPPSYAAGIESIIDLLKGAA